MEDVEKLRYHLKIKRWLVLGGSHGCTIAMIYAQEHTSRFAFLSVSCRIRHLMHAQCECFGAESCLSHAKGRIGLGVLSCRCGDKDSASKQCAFHSVSFSKENHVRAGSDS